MLHRVTGPTWLIDLVAAVMLATAGYCASRVVVARWRARVTQTDVDLAHVAMGLAMADMLLRPPGPVLSRIGLLGFTVVGGYFAARGIQHYIDGRGAVAAGLHLQHAVGSGAMLLMLVPMSRAATGNGMPGMTVRSVLGSASPAMTVVAVLLMGLAVTSVGRVLASPQGPTPGPLTPRLGVCCQALMTATMGYLLLAV
jgi:hypothetical protein